ncbi:hypothetical protein GYMLUDRAFT_253166 [Collybiopsis luxurians FD-317 M1]|uniref:Uncharacterized protein n=1 Tax=Collybiopsis luxurians FD-317 M1 TaxID=944289 RepID=A0A0D0B7X1_9AGAR|nr:hypothetical protein GYMLUDRAFT_253166 [Collybiopsis luxurians FD-317 M1]
MAESPALPSTPKKPNGPLSVDYADTDTETSSNTPEGSYPFMKLSNGPPRPNYPCLELAEGEIPTLPNSPEGCYIPDEVLLRQYDLEQFFRLRNRR